MKVFEDIRAENRQEKNSLIELKPVNKLSFRFSDPVRIFLMKIRFD